jgi:hypothetical protein
MSVVVRNEVVYDHDFDPKTKRHSINGIQSVLHCHHYTSLYTQLAIDAGETALLQESARDSFRSMLGNYLSNHENVDNMKKKIDIGCQYFSLIGLGTMRVNYLGDDSAEVELLSSHTDEGWKKKWGEYDKPVNYIAAGFIEALLESVLMVPARSFSVKETTAIVMGAKTSTFKASRR